MTTTTVDAREFAKGVPYSEITRFVAVTNPALVAAMERASQEFYQHEDTLERYAAARYDPVHVWVMGERRAPGLEDAGKADSGAEMLGIGGDGETFPALSRMSAPGGKDAMRLKDAASSSFDCFHIDLKEQPDGTVSSIELQRTVYLCGSGAEQEQLAFGDPGSGAG